MVDDMQRERIRIKDEVQLFMMLVCVLREETELYEPPPTALHLFVQDIL